MTNLNISWSTFKTVIASTSVYYVDRTDRADVYAASKDILFCTTVTGDDLADFEANYKLNATACSSSDDAAAMALVGANAVKIPPVTDDGRIVSVTNSYPDGTVLQISGCGDDREEGRGQGQALYFYNKDPGDYTLEWGYNDSVWLTGGGAFIHGSEDARDYFSLEAYCPATPVVVSSGGTGNCNIVSGIIIPAAGNGAYEVDLGEANPVPAPGGAGYWDWNHSIIGLGTVTASQPGEGNSLLIAADLLLNVFASEVHFVGSTAVPFIVPDIVASHVWPFWKMRLKLHVVSSGVDFACHVILARYDTTP
jgi:hypothetical protein